MRDRGSRIADRGGAAGRQGSSGTAGLGGARTLFRDPRSAIRDLSILLLVLLSLPGCKHPKKDPGNQPKKEKPGPLPPSVGLGAGRTMVFQSDDPKSPPSFSLAWTQGGLGVADGSVKTGHLVAPKGHLYDKGKESATFRADTGDADRDANRLNLDGAVRLQSTTDAGHILIADHGEYRGDLRLVRATGKVVATGPFGTLSGAPELWATSDLLVIGTPKMVSQKLKIPALAALAATAALGSPKLQKGVTYSLDNQGETAYENLKTGVRLTIQPKIAGKPLVLRMPDRGLVLESAGTVVLDFAPKANDVRHVTTSGKVHVVQTTSNGTTTLDGHDAVYDWDWKARADTADLDVPGPVTIVRSAKVKAQSGALVTQITTTKGQKGSAVLVNKPKGDQDGLRSATLNGVVTLDVSEVDGQSFSGAGDRMVYTPRGETTTVDASGRVRLVRLSKDKDGGTSRTVAVGNRGNAVLFSRPAQGTNPLRSAVLDGAVRIDVSGSNDETFQGTGDRLVYEASGDKGKATMTGALRFSGSSEAYFGDMTDVDTAVMTIGKEGWERIVTSNANGAPTNSTVGKKDVPAKKKGGSR